jgi:hypothetical protein
MSIADEVAALTPQERARLVERLRRRNPRPAAGGIPRAPRGRPVAASVAQEQIWLLQQLDRAGTAYNVVGVTRLHGRLDPAALAGAVTDLVARHEALRTTFGLRDGVLEQRVGAAGPVELPVTDLRPGPGGVHREQVDARVAAHSDRPFDLATGPLLRCELLRTADDDHLLVFCLHHIVCDGWSLDVVMRELGPLYRARTEGRPDPLPPPALQYSDYAAWQRERTGGDAAGLRYCRDRLAGAPATFGLPADLPRLAVPSAAGARHVTVVPPPVAHRVVELGRTRGATPFAVLLAAFWVLVHERTAEPMVCLATPVANRGHRDLHGVVGLFANTLPLTARIDEQVTFGELVDEAGTTLREALAHQDVPFELIARAAGPARDRSHAAFSDLMVAMRTPLAELDLPGLAAEHVPVGVDRSSKYDLEVEFEQGSGGIEARFVYRAELFRPGTVERLAGRLGELLAVLVDVPDRPVADAAPAGAALLAGPVAAPDERCLPELVAEHAARTPGAPAVVDRDLRLSYGELSARAERLARLLAARGAAPERLVGVLLPRSADLVVALLGGGPVRRRVRTGGPGPAGRADRRGARGGRAGPRGDHRAAGRPVAGGHPDTDRRGRGRAAGARSPATARGTGQYRVRALHLRLDRAAEGRGGQPPGTGALPVLGPQGLSRAGVRGCAALACRLRPHGDLAARRARRWWLRHRRRAGARTAAGRLPQGDPQPPGRAAVRAGAPR